MATEDTSPIFTVTIAGQEHTIDAGDLTVQEHRLIRKAVGFTLEELLTTFDIVSLTVLLWMARRHSHEPGLSYVEVERYMTDLGGMKAVNAGTITLTRVATEAADGEDDEVDTVDPLP